MSNGPTCHFLAVSKGSLYKTVALWALVILYPQGPFLNSVNLFKHPRPSPVSLAPLSLCLSLVALTLQGGEGTVEMLNLPSSFQHWGFHSSPSSLSAAASAMLSGKNLSLCREWS